ncbi:MAG: hypothetical protein KKD69_05225 [Euryarchaeota archaeon]|nr:hypothetical protein [Euryarchaeota archaeon]
MDWLGAGKTRVHRHYLLDVRRLQRIAALLIVSFLNNRNHSRTINFDRINRINRINRI